MNGTCRRAIFFVLFFLCKVAGIAKFVMPENNTANPMIVKYKKVFGNAQRIIIFA